MSFRFYFFLLFFKFLLMFYPGDNKYLQAIAFNSETFEITPDGQNLRIKPVPIVNQFAPAPQVSAAGVYIINADSFTPLFEKNPHTLFFPASTTKIITALVAFDLYTPDDVITVTNVKSEGQVMNLIPNERITAENLLYGMLVHSGNDAAYAFADNIGYDKFINLMNQKAKNLKKVSFRISHNLQLPKLNSLQNS